MAGGKVLWAALAAVVLTFAAGATALAAVTTTGSIYNSGNEYYVGYTDSSTGTLTINGGSLLSKANGYVGYTATSTGTATVTGSGSKWTNSGNLYVGRSGNGTLNIQANGQVSNTTGYVGYNSGSTGTATVTGSGSTWTNSGNLYVGYSGNGTLNIQANGQVINAAGSIGSLGAVTVTGSGSKWTNVNGLAVNGTLNIQANGQVSNATGSIGGAVTVTGSGSKWTNVGGLTVFSGVLGIEAGGQVSSSFGYLKGINAFPGTVTVTGNGSKWTNTYDVSVGYDSVGTLSVRQNGQATARDLSVGEDGYGTLSIESGGLVSSVNGYLGHTDLSPHGSTGTATVTGSGSRWTNSGDLHVGLSGNGTLNIQGNGQVSSAKGYIGYYADSIGTVTVTGSGSKWTNTGELCVGTYGSGTLRIEANGQVSSIMGYIGRDSSSTGTATVTGSGSKWTNSGDLNVGFYGGNGTLRIEANGQVSSGSGYVGWYPGSTGTVTVAGNGSTWTSNRLIVGKSGSGTLRIEANGQVSSTTGHLGSNSGSTGTATVTGTGSMWANRGNLYVGDAGAGTLTVADGGNVTTGMLFASLSDLHGNGTITVAQGAVLDTDLFFDGAHGLTQALPFGTGGTLNLCVNSAGNLGAGYKGTGTVRIADGITVADAVGYLGYNSGSAGTATITGNSSKWTHANEIYVGNSGSGTLRIEAGALVSNTNGYLGYNLGSTGAAMVTGAGSTWANSGDLYVGAFGTGTGMLTVADGGLVSARNISINNKSAVNLHVSGNGLIVLGNAALAGSVNNNGKINLYADSFLAAGAYTPISDCNGRAMTWTGTGSTQGFGGTWNVNNKTFNVADLTLLASGNAEPVSAGERMLFTDPASGKKVGAAFGNVTGSPTFAAGPMGAAALAGLAVTDGFEGDVLSAWDFNTTLAAGTEVFLSFDIGPGVEDPQVWHYDNAGTWTPMDDSLVTYDAESGILSLSVTGFSGYAVSAVPEPATLALVALGGLTALRRRRR